MIKRIGIVGAGAWGAALAITALRAGREVVLWAHKADTVDAIRTLRESPYLPGIVLAEGITGTGDLAAVADTDAILLAPPAQRLREVCLRLAPHWRKGAAAVICSKGIERQGDALMSEAVAAALPTAGLAVLSGPSFAIEVARGMPTAVTLACADAALGRKLVQALGTSTFRPYLSDDVIGVQIGGARS